MSLECVAKAYEARHLGLRPRFQHSAFSAYVAHIPIAISMNAGPRPIGSLLRSFNRVKDFAIKIERLNPQVANRLGTGINVEYPWIVAATVESPVKYPFSRSYPRSKRLSLMDMLDNLLIFEGY